MGNRFVTTALAALALALAACSNDSGYQGLRTAHEAGKGTARIYDATFDQAWQAVHVALKWSDAGRAEDHPATGGEAYVITNPDTDAKSYNAQVGVWLDPMNTAKTRVSVVVVGADNNMGGPNEEGLQRDIATAMNIIRAGQAVPEKRP